MKVNCPGCDRAYKVDDHRIPETGLKMRCPQCSRSFTVTKSGVADAAERGDGSGADAGEGTIPDVPKSGGMPVMPARPSVPPKRPSLLGTPPRGADDSEVSGMPPVLSGGSYVDPFMGDPDFSDLPAPKSGTRQDDMFGAMDLPVPRSTGSFSGVDLPAPKVDDPFGSIDLPMPAGVTDLPTPAGAMDLPGKEDDDPFGEMDLPTPSRAMAAPVAPPVPPAAPPSASKTVAFGEIGVGDPLSAKLDLASAPLGKPRAPSALPGPFDDPLGGFDLSAPPPKNPTVHGLGAPMAPSALPGPPSFPPLGAAFGGLSAPPAASAPAAAPVPPAAPAKPTTGTFTLPSLPPAMPSSSQSLGRVKTSGSTTFGEIDLGAPPQDDGGEFDAFPVKKEEERSAEAGPRDSGLDIQDDYGDIAKRGSVIDERVPSAAEGRSERRTGVEFEGRRKYERQSRRLRIVLLVLIVVVGLVGAGMAFTPLGPFGAYALAKLLPRAGVDKMMVVLNASVDKGLSDDTFQDVGGAVSRVEEALREMPDNEDLRLYGVFLHNWHQIRFGDDKAHDAAVTRLLGAINIEKSESQYAPLAIASSDIRGLRVPKAVLTLNGPAGATPNGLALLAEAQLIAGDYAAAILTARKLQAKQKSARASYIMVRALLRAGQKDKGVELLGEMVKANPRHSDAKLALAAIMLEARKRDPAAIRALLDAVAGAVPSLTSSQEKARAHALLGRLCLKEREYAKAGSEFELAGKSSDKDVVMLVGRGELALLDDDFTAAATAFAKARSEDPSDVEATLGQADTLIRQGMLAESRGILQDLLPKQPNNARLHYLLGRLAVIMKNMDEAMKEFGAANALDKEYLDPYVALSEVYFKTGRDMEAMRTLDEAAKTVPSAALVNMTLADAYASRGDFATAIVELGRALDKEPDNVRAHFRMAQMYRSMGSFGDAANSLKEVEKRNPRYNGLATEQGLLMELSGKVEEALAVYEKTLAANPTDLNLKIRVGGAAHFLGKDARAESVLNEALAQDPKSAEANFYMGEVLRSTARPAEAIAYLQTAAALDDSNAHYHLRLGTVFADVRDTAKAMHEYERAKELDPKMAEVYMRIGELRLRDGAVKDAIALFDQSLALDPRLAEAYGLVGEAFEQLSDLRTAVAYYRKAVQQLPDNGGLFFKLGMAELTTSGPNAASASLLRAASLAEKADPRPSWYLESLYRLGTAQALSGQRASAISTFKHYLDVAPESAIDRGEVQAELDRLGG
ncbi:MAG: tetratricopeptide repeat protein [Deltaproteobacteria bacterium]|nr:tetratricopeptide repeat protein [Deltaproteobacteria bacterium]